MREQPRSSSNLGKPTGPWLSTVLPGCKPSRPDSSGPAGSIRIYRLWPTRPPVCGSDVAAPSLPTAPGAMLRYLFRTRAGDNPPPVESFIHAGDLLRQDYLLPAERAALFRALERIRGVSLVQHTVNLTGRTGIAVQQTYHGISQQLIFDPRSYTFIGEREVAVSASSGVRVGTLMDATSGFKIAIVDHVGQLP
jgi:hypothetical protein